VNIAVNAHSSAGTASGTYTVTVNVTSGWVYIQLPDPGAGFTLSRVVRSDGTVIPVGDQAWTTDRTFNAAGNATIDNELHILDLNSTGSYTVYYVATEATPPTSSVTALPGFSTNSFTVRWSGSDGRGSGIASYSIYVSDNGGPFTPWLSGDTETSATYTGVDGHTYGFYSVATDNGGLVQATPPGAQATITVDTTAPTSRVAALPAFSPPSFTVSWSGSDGSGSGIATYDVYVSVDGGAITRWQQATTQTSAVYTGTSGHTYAFYSIATDNAGNVQAPPLVPDAQTTVSASNLPPVLGNIADQAVPEGSLVTFTATATDPDPGKLLTFSLDPSAPVGASIDPATGVFTFTPDDGPASFSVTVRVIDDGSPPLSDAKSFTIDVADVPPSATFGVSGPVALGSPVTVQFTNPFDPSAADQAAGFRYSYDLDGDGIFEIVDDSAASQTVTFTTPGTHTVHGRIRDKDGFATDYTLVIAPALRLEFDAGTAAPAFGYLSVRGSDTYTPARGYGWLTAAPEFERSGPTPLLRAGHYGSAPNTFRMDLAPGTYRVSVTVGDANYPHDDINITVVAGSGVGLAGLSNAPGQFVQRSFLATTDASGQLALQFSDGGGYDPYWVVNSLEVRPVATIGSLTLTGPGSVPADGTSPVDTDTIQGTGATPGALVTVSTTLGTIVGADADPNYAGIQVQADADGNFSFQVQRPTAGGTAVITAEDVTGASLGSTTITYTAPTARRLDFNTTGSPTADGYLGVRGADVYTPTRGFGWLTPAAEFGRSGPTPLLQDGHYGLAPNTLRVDLQPDTYRVSVTVGDANYPHDDINISVVAGSGAGLAGLSNAPGQFVQRSFLATTDASGQLALQFSDGGGFDPYWVVNALDIRPAATVGTLILTGPGSAPADGSSLVHTDTIQGTGATPRAVIAIETTLGTVVSADADPNYAGVVVQADANGNFSFQVQRPTAGGTAVITAEDVSGTSLGSTTITYTAPTVRRLDFITTGAPTADGYLGVRGTDLYTPARGFGWLTAAPEFGRGVGNALVQDGHYGSLPNTFQLDLAPGTYQVTVTAGDTVYPHDDIDVRVNGVSQLGGQLISNAPGQVVVRSFTVTVGTDGHLPLQFLDLGGFDPYWVVNGLDVRPVASVLPLTVTGPGGTLEADGSTIDPFSVTVPAGVEVTLSTSLGAIVGLADADPTYAGFQVIGTGAPISFGVQRPTGAGLATITAEEVSGAYSGSLSQTYGAGRTRLFDLNGSSNLTQGGYLGVRGFETYTDSRGYGWLAPAAEFERAGPDNLLFDGHYGAAPNTFRIEVDTSAAAPASYQVTAVLGDYSYAHDQIQVAIGGTGLSQTIPYIFGGTFVTLTFTVPATALPPGSVAGTGYLDVQFADLGGIDPYWVVNALTVQPVASAPEPPPAASVPVAAAPSAPQRAVAAPASLPGNAVVQPLLSVVVSVPLVIPAPTAVTPPPPAADDRQAVAAVLAQPVVSSPAPQIATLLQGPVQSPQPATDRPRGGVVVTPELERQLAVELLRTARKRAGEAENLDVFFRWFGSH
jgi:fibronectin type 3 domain-containing protein